MMSSGIENELSSIDLNPQDNQMNMPEINFETLIDELRLAAKFVSDVDNLCALKSKLTVNKCSIDLNESAKKHSLEWPPNLASEVKDAIMLGISSQPMFDDIINQLDSLSNEVGGIAIFVKEVVNQLADSKDKNVNFNILKDIVKNIK